jgi:hypothetical protein
MTNPAAKGNEGLEGCITRYRIVLYTGVIVDVDVTVDTTDAASSHKGGSICQALWPRETKDLESCITRYRSHRRYDRRSVKS